MSAIRKQVKAGIIDAERVRPKLPKPVQCRLPADIVAILTATAAREGIDEATLVATIIHAWLERQRSRVGYKHKPEAVLSPELVTPPVGEVKSKQIMLRLSKGNFDTLSERTTEFAPLTRQQIVRRLIEDWIISSAQRLVSETGDGGKFGQPYRDLKKRVDVQARRLREPGVIFMNMIAAAKKASENG